MKQIYHFTNYDEFIQELNSYKGDFYKIVRSGNVAIITFKNSNEFVACLQYVKLSEL